MKILAVRVAEVGPFASGVALEGLSGGLDVLTGPNEAGKSTLFTALATLIGEKHTSTAKDVAMLRPDSGGAPLIEADLEIDGRLWRLRKRYLAQKAADLTDLVSGERLRGHDAEERVLTLLGSREAMRGFVWVPQQKSFDLPDHRERIAPGLVAELSALIEQEVADAAGAGFARRLRAEVAARLAEQVTAAHGKAKANSALDLARRKRDEIVRSLDVARLKADAAQVRLARLALLREERKTAVRADAHGAVAARVALTRKAVTEAEQARERLRTANERVNARQFAFDSARAAVDELERRVVERGRVEATAVVDREALATVSELQVGAQERAGMLQADAEAAAVAVAACRDSLALAHATELRLAAGNAARAELAEIDRRLAEAAGAAAEIAAAEQALVANPASDAIADLVKGFSARLAALEAEVAAGAPRASFAYVLGATGRIRIGGRVVEAGERLLIERPTEIVIDGIGSIMVEPPVNDRAAAADLRDACRDDLVRVLENIGVADVAAAERLVDDRRQHERTLAVARARLQSAASGGIDHMKERRKKAAAGATVEDVADLPDRASLEKRCRMLEAELGEKREALARALLAVRANAEEIARLEARFAAHRQSVADLDAELPPPEALDAERRSRATTSEAAATALGEAVRERTAWQEAAQEDQGFDRLVAAASLATAELVRFEQEAQGREREIATLEGEMRRDGADGVGAEIAELEGSLASVEARVADLELEVRALGMLRDRLDRVGSSHRNLVLKPMLERMQGMIEVLLPDARLALEGPLLVTRIERPDRSDTMARLSGGTREQVATLVRLAYADLMAARGVSLPLVLDDALVFSDDERLGLMMGLLADAARRHQVIMLSCRSTALEPLLVRHGARRLEIVPWADAERLQPAARTAKGRTGSPASDHVR